MVFLSDPNTQLVQSHAPLLHNDFFSTLNKIIKYKRGVH